MTRHATGMPSPALPDRLLTELAVVAGFILAPLAAFQPVMISLLSVALCAWAGINGWRRLQRPSRLLLLGVAVVAIALVLLAHKQVLGKEPGLSLLSMLMPLKLLESRNTRDARVALMLGLFLQIGLFALSQDSWLAGCVLLNTGLLLAATARVQSPHLPLQPAGRLAGRLLLQAIPLMLILFLLFPRIDGPLWGLPMDAFSGRTGLSDSMEPGAINSLAMSSEIVMRVEFPDGPPPPNRLRYWRGPVLTEFDGRKWTALASAPQSRLNIDRGQQSIRYASTLEPHNQRWLLALDYPAPGSAERFNRDYIALARNPVRNRMRLEMTAWPDARIGLDEPDWLLNASRRLPPQSNPRSVAQGQEIAVREPDPARRAGAILAFMRGAGLQYTLYPPTLGEHTADEFLFDTRMGFCEHFASAFVIMARAAGLPARVVTGYQGGEINPFDNTLVIRQSDAHAWAEVWLAGEGWRRIDPTAASYPQRIDSGLTQALPQTETLPLGLRRDLPWLQQLRFRWEALGNAWNQWVLGYNASRQMELMRKLGMPEPDWQKLGALLTAGVSLWLAWAAWQYRARAPRRDALDRTWHSLQRRLARRGGPRHDWEGPLAYITRIAPQFGTEADALIALAEDYARLRFGPRAATAEDVRMLALRIRQLRLQ